MDWGIVAKFTGVVVAMLDPIGNLPIYLQETSKDEPRVQRNVSLLLAGAVGIALVAIFIGGRGVLGFFGISLPAFMIAGGLLLLMYGLKRLHEAEEKPGASVATAGANARFRTLLVPVCIPLFVGPGTISTVVVYSQLSDGPLMTAAMLCALVVATIVVGATLLGGGLVKRLLGETGLTVVGRLMGLILAAVGVELLLRGLGEAMPGLFA